MFSLNVSRGNGGAHGYQAIVFLLLDVFRVDSAVLHVILNNAIVSMQIGALSVCASARLCSLRVVSSCTTIFLRVLLQNK